MEVCGFFFFNIVISVGEDFLSTELEAVVIY